MEDRRTRTAAVGALLIFPIILLFLGYMLALEFQRNTEAAAEIELSHQVRAELQTLLSLHQDVETGQRGYVITGDPRFLEPYQAASRQIGFTFDRLGRILEPSSPLVSGLRDLRGLSREKLAFASRTVALETDARTEDARRLIAGGEGKRRMDAIRARINGMDRIERDRLALRTEAGARAHDQTRQLTFILLGLLGFLLITASLVIIRTFRARHQLLEQLRDVAARQHAILDSATDAIITLNPSGSIESLNRAAEVMYGYSTKELLRRDIGLLFEIAPDRGQVQSFLRRIGVPNGNTVARTQQIHGRHRDGHSFPTEVAVSAMPLADGIYYVAIIRDITERKRIEQMKSEFVSTVSHELRTPLTSIAGSLGLLSGGAAGALPERAARLVNIAHNNSERLIRLINDILDIEKIESGRMAFEIAPQGLRTLLDQAIDANRAFAEARGIRLALAPPPEDATVLADADRLTQVFTNLLSNAVKFSPPEGVVDISTLRRGRAWRVTVRDHGQGVPEAFRDRIFGKFAQADSSDTRAKGGTGLGLNIVREIMARIGGSVGFDSVPGEGAAFHVDIPVAPENERPLMERATGSLPMLLHLEDDPDVLRVVAEAFDGRAAVTPATTLKDARAALAGKARYDLIILDIGLAGESGLDLLRPPGTTLPVVIFTAQDADRDMARSADAVLTKSRATLDQLVETVESLIDGKGRV